MIQFKSEEDLIKESEPDNWKVKEGYVRSSDYHAGVNDGIRKAFSSIAERKKFYETYENRWDLLKVENPNVFNEFIKTYEHTSVSHTVIEHLENSCDFSHYRHWLYHFCFDGVK